MTSRFLLLKRNDLFVAGVSKSETSAAVLDDQISITFLEISANVVNLKVSFSSWDPGSMLSQSLWCTYLHWDRFSPSISAFSFQYQLHTHTHLHTILSRTNSLSLETLKKGMFFRWFVAIGYKNTLTCFLRLPRSNSLFRFLPKDVVY